MRGPISITSDNQTVKISKESDPLSARSIPLSEINQALSDHYQKNPGELSQNRDFSFTYKYKSNEVDYKLKVTSRESRQSESRALDRDGKKIPISIENIKAQAKEFEEKRLKIKNAVIDFFTKNPNETPDSKDKIIVYNTTNNQIKTQSNTYQLSSHEQQITINENTKLEIAEKKQIRLTTINYFTENPNEPMDRDFYYDKNSGSIKTENQSQDGNQFKQISISDADKNEIKERRKIKKIAIDFFLENHDESLDLIDKKVVYIKASNKIKTMPQKYQIPESEQLIIISDNTKYEITQKRLEMTRERISLLESENRNLATTNLSLRNELKTSQDRSEGDRELISRLESENRKLGESLDTSLQKIEKLLGIENTTKNNESGLSVATAWLPPASLPTSADSNSSNTLLPPATNSENRLEKCLVAIKQLAQKSSEKKESTESLDKLLQKLEEALGIEDAKIMNLDKLSAVSAWLSVSASNELPNVVSAWLPAQDYGSSTSQDSNSRASSWLPPAPSIEYRLEKCLDTIIQRAQKKSSESESPSTLPSQESSEPSKKSASKVLRSDGDTTVSSASALQLAVAGKSSETGK